jgi:hypothetical protein
VGRIKWEEFRVEKNYENSGRRGEYYLNNKWMRLAAVIYFSRDLILSPLLNSHQYSVFNGLSFLKIRLLGTRDGNLINSFPVNVFFSQTCSSWNELLPSKRQLGVILWKRRNYAIWNLMQEWWKKKLKVSSRWDVSWPIFTWYVGTDLDQSRSISREMSDVLRERSSGWIHW